MIRKLILLGLAGLIAAGALGMFPRGKEQKVYAATAVDPAAKQHILAATVRLVLFAPLLDENGQPQMVMVDGQAQAQYVTGEGLGTLVNLNGETMIVTHDHWTLLDTLQMARFYDAAGNLLAEVTGDAFRQLIRYRDGGTMVLALPTPLTTTAVNGNAQLVQPEDVVFLTYRLPNSDLLDVLVMGVADVYERNGRDVFALVSLNGEIVGNGNSGGGVWYQGKLVGNMWVTVKELPWFWEKSDTPKGTDTSVAALLPTAVP